MAGMNSVGANSRMNQHGLPSRQHAAMGSSRVARQPTPHGYHPGGPPPTDLAELVSLVSAQQSTLYSQQAEIKQCDAESSYLEQQYFNSQQQQHLPPTGSSTSSLPGGGVVYHPAPGPGPGGPGGPGGNGQQPGGNQIDVVLSEVRRLEEVAQRNDEELSSLSVDGKPVLLPSTHPDTGSVNFTPGNSDNDSSAIQSEISALRARLAGTDQELQKTNSTLRRLGDEMRSMSMEKSRQREAELLCEIDKLQADIRLIQRSSEEGANVSQKLSKEVKEVEDKISARKAEVEKLIREMREANLESLAISPPEESKQFLEGPSKNGGGTARKMMGSPRALENAVPTAKNPHGVWV